MSLDYLDHMAEPWIDQATAAFQAALSEIVGTQSPSLDPVAAGRSAALEALAGAHWTDEIGPFYDSAGVRQLLGQITKQAVSDRVQRHRLLALRTGSGRLVYPTFQFNGRDVTNGLPEVLGIVAPDNVEAWYTASWLTTPDPALGGRSPIVALKSGQTNEVAAAARELAGSLRG